jgi:hypothetical protein
LKQHNAPSEQKQHREQKNSRYFAEQFNKQKIDGTSTGVHFRH